MNKCFGYCTGFCRSPVTFCFVIFTHPQWRNLEWHEATFVTKGILAVKAIKLFNVVNFGGNVARSNRRRKHFQTFLIMPFLDRHVKFTQKPWAHLCCWGVSYKPFPQCASTSWSREGSKLEAVWAKISFWRPTSSIHSLCRVFQRSVLLEDVIWFLSDNLNSWKHFRLQKFFVNGRG